MGSEDKGDDEIEIDFSGIKKFFGGKKDKKSSKHSENKDSEEKHEEKISENKHNKKESHEEHNADSDDEISFDFSKIKNIFSGKKKEKKHDVKKNSSDDSEEIEINTETLEKIKGFYKKYWPYFLIIVPILLTIFIRVQPLELTITNDWATNSVYNYYHSAIQDQVKQKYPNLPDTNLQPIVDQQFNTFVSQNKATVDQQIAATATSLKAFFQYTSGSHTYTYMGDIDSYYWLREARNIQEKGYLCDVIENGVCYDTYTLAPLKLPLPKVLHPYAIVATYDILKPFNSDITLMQAQLIVPIIFAVIAAMLVYIMLMRMYGPIAGLTASILMTASPIFLSRSLGSDTDIYNIFFPVLIIFFAYEAFISQTWKKKAIYAGLTGLSIGAYSFAWTGWWYMFDFVFIAIITDLVYDLIRGYYKTKKFNLNHIIKSSKGKNAGAMIGSLLVFSFLSIGLSIGFSSFSVVYTGPFSFLSFKAAANPSLWPNVLTTVAEFNSSSIPTIISQIGGQWWFFLALLGFIILIFKDFEKTGKGMVMFLISAALLYYLVIPGGGPSLKPFTYIFLFGLPFLAGMIYLLKSDEETEDIKLPVLLFLWVSASIFATLTGVRFTLLLVPPIAVGAGISLGFFHKTLTRWVADSMKVKKGVVSFIIFVLLAYTLIAPANAGVSAAKQYLPNVNDQWWSALTQIKDNSQPDAIINSWWDFGHWFKYIADRRVTLDGASQNNPQLMWLGKTLLTPDEKQAAGTLQMLDCGGNHAFDAVDSVVNNIPKSADLLNQVILEDRTTAKNTLIENGFSDSQAEKVLDNSDCNPPEDFFITSQDMIGKGGVWAHFGSWDFKKAWMHRTYDASGSDVATISKFVDEFNMSEEQASNYVDQIRNLVTDSDVNAWIAPWPSYVQDEAGCQNDSEIVTCTLQQAIVIVNLTTMDAYLSNGKGGIARPDVFSYTTPTGTNIKYYNENTIGVGMLLMIKKTGYSAVFMSPELTNSTFTKLYYLNGHGTRYFDPFSNTVGLNGFKISVWKVNWQGRNEPIIIDDFNVTNPYYAG